jgi:hypothetical protein
MYDKHLFPLFHQISKFPQLERLILDKIDSSCLKNLFQQFISLPFLSSLTIIMIDDVKDIDYIYHQIFRLSTLKYCQLSFENRRNDNPLLMANNEHSSIEHLVINNGIHLRQLNSLLTYVPQLRRLSFQSVDVYGNNLTKIYPVVLNKLTHVSLRSNSIKFDQIEQLFINLFSSIEVLHISTGIECADGNRWQQLISYHLPNLRVFDILSNVYLRNNDNRLRLEDQFRSPFWIEQQCFFEYGDYQSSHGKREIFYSTNPYRYIRRALGQCCRIIRRNDTYSHA